MEQSYFFRLFSGAKVDHYQAYQLLRLEPEPKGGERAKGKRLQEEASVSAP
jgi:hypothetical protein